MVHEDYHDSLSKGFIVNYNVEMFFIFINRLPTVNIIISQLINKQFDNNFIWVS